MTSAPASTSPAVLETLPRILGCRRPARAPAAARPTPAAWCGGRPRARPLPRGRERALALGADEIDAVHEAQRPAELDDALEHVVQVLTEHQRGDGAELTEVVEPGAGRDGRGQGQVDGL